MTRIRLIDRAAAFGAAGCAVAGAVAATVALVAGPAPGLAGYVSEAGIAANPWAPTYRLGIFGLAAALLLLAAALYRPMRAAAALLVAGAAGTTVSGAVPCSTACPLPPMAAPTAADLVHGGASIVAVACCVFAMLVLATPIAPVRTLYRIGGTVAALRRLAGVADLVGRLPTPAPAVRRLGMAASVAALPLAALVGGAMLLLGRGPVTGVLERLLLLVIVFWLVATALWVGFAPRPIAGAGACAQNSTVAKVPTGRKPHRA